MSQQSNQSNPPIIANRSLEKIRTKLKIIDEQSREEKLTQIRQMLKEEATEILMPAIQDAFATMTLQFLPDPKIAQSMERTSQEVGRLANNMNALADAQKAAHEQARLTTEAVAEAMDEMVSETVQAMTSVQAKSTDEMLREQKLMAKKQRFWTVMTVFVATLVLTALGLGAVGYTRWEQRTKLGTEIASLRQDHLKAQAEMEKTLREATDLKTQKDTLQAQIDHLRSEETSVRLQIKQSTDTVTAVNQARSQAQTDIRKLQDIQEKNRFKLLQGQEGNVFVEIPTNAKPFMYQGKTYVKVEEKE